MIHAENTARCPDRFTIAVRAAESVTRHDRVDRIADGFAALLDRDAFDGGAVVLDDDAARSTDERAAVMTTVAAA